MCDLTGFCVSDVWMERWKIALEKLFLSNLTHIVSGILELLVLDSWRDCAHKDTDKSLSMMQSKCVKSFLRQCENKTHFMSPHVLLIKKIV